MRAFEGLALPDESVIARVTFELLRPVPLAPLAVDAAVIRAGRRVQLLEGTITNEDGVELVRARGLAMARAVWSAADGQAAGSLPPGPQHGRDSDISAPFRPMFTPDAIELRFVQGGFTAPGPATAWFRLLVPLVAGEVPSPLQRLVAAGDFGNGISATLSWNDHLYINPDLTLYIERPPIGEWVCLESGTRIAAGGVGMSESVLYDERGRVGRATQALLVAPR